MHKYIIPLAALFHLFCFAVSKEADYNTAASSQPYERITPEAGPRVVGGLNIFFTADFLWWAVREDGLEYAYTNGTGGPAKPPKGRVKKPDFDWEPGFKAGVGLNFSHDGWDLYGQYTRVHSNSATDNLEGPFMPLWAVNNMILTTNVSSNVRWDMHFNVIDIELGRNFYVSRYLKLRPSTGFKITWQNQDYLLRYFNEQNQVLVTERMRIKQDMWGFGLRFALNTSWQFNRYWCLYGDVALSGLFSQFKVERRDSEIIAIENTTLYTENDFHTIFPVFEWGFGIRYEYWWGEDRFHTLLQVGWEEQIWLRQNQFFNNSEDNPYISRGNDLFLHGFTVKGRFDF